MNCSPTLSAEEFKILHNTLWDLDCLQDERVQVLVERIRKQVLGRAYEQDNRAFETKHDYYSNFQESLKLSAIWSIYELEPGEFSKEHPYKGAVQLAYSDHWGDKPVFVEIKGSKWSDLYKAADEAIRLSGDNHHIFIERFSPNPKEPQQLRLTTGS